MGHLGKLRSRWCERLRRRITLTIVDVARRTCHDQYPSRIRRAGFQQAVVHIDGRVKLLESLTSAHDFSPRVAEHLRIAITATRCRKPIVSPSIRPALIMLRRVAASPFDASSFDCLPPNSWQQRSKTAWKRLYVSNVALSISRIVKHRLRLPTLIFDDPKLIRHHNVVASFPVSALHQPPVVASRICRAHGQRRPGRPRSLS